MEQSPCHFISTRWCRYSAEQCGSRVNVTSLAKRIDADTVLRMMFTSDEIRDEIRTRFESGDPSAHGMDGLLADGLCKACRETVEDAGVTDIREDAQ
jgi:hypothetical protein